MAEFYRWGILGPGKIAHQFAQALSVTQKGELWGVASRSMHRAEAFSKQYGAKKSYGSYADLIQDPEIDAIYIATPHHLHHPLSKECIEHGKAVLCEKPISINAQQFDALSKMAKEKEVFYMDALWTRFLPTIKKTLELIDEMGPVVNMRADFGFNAHYDPKSRLFNQELGGGSLLDIGIYPVFLALFLLGKPDEILCRARIGQTGVDESFAAIFKYDSGILANLSSTIIADTKTEAEIACKEGTIYIHERFHMPSHLEVRRKGQNAEFNHFDYPKNGYEFEIEEVMNCLDQGLIESPNLPHDFTLLLMETLDEIRRQIGLFYNDIEEVLTTH